jgi:16S rRNA (cytidine1402-2'-O)-methyltransferase
MESDQSLKPGLYLIGTPIGNRADWSERARAVLRQAQLIACEDTRHARKLLDPLELKVPLVAYHEHNETTQAERLADAVATGQVVALMTDAGMPGISDPGFRAVRSCRRRGLPVIPIPGPVAFTTAWAASGLPTDSIVFLGFLPPKSAARRRTLEEYRNSQATLGCYESTHRIHKFLDEIVDVLGPDRCICVARELTKFHETIHTGPAESVRAAVLAGSSKGEFVVLIAKEGYTLE